MVGTKGQVVIPKEIRERLGSSLAGWRFSGSWLTTTSVPTGKAWQRAREAAWKKAAKAKVRSMNEG